MTNWYEISAFLILAACYILKTLDLIYRFQIKEYRFDRFGVYLQEDGAVRILYTESLRTPKRSMRNLLITLISGAVGIPILYILPGIIQIATDLPALVSSIILVPFVPLLSIAVTASAVNLTEPLAQAKRMQIIDKAKEKRKRQDLTVIGITGSYGKSSVKEFVYTLLSSTYSTAKTTDNHNTDVGVAQSFLANVTDSTKYFVSEMGAYKQGEIASICDIVKPSIGIITALGNQHLALFGSPEKLLHAKKELAKSIPQDGTLYINAHIQPLNELISDLSCKVVTYGRPDAPNKADAILEGEGGRYRLSYAGWQIEFEMNILGNHNALNMIPAILIAHEHKIGDRAIVEAVSHVQNIKNKLTQTKGIHGAVILNDVYSSNVEGFLSALDTLQSLPQQQKIVLSRGIIELGDDKLSSYKKITDKIQSYGMKLVTTDSDFEKSGIGEWCTVKHESDLQQYIAEIATPETAILLEGRFPDSIITFIATP